MQTKYYHIILAILGAISSILTFYGNIYYNPWSNNWTAIFLALTMPGILSVLLSIIIYHNFPSEKDVDIRLKFLLSFLIGYFILWHSLYVTNVLYSRPPIINLPEYLVIALGFALALSMSNNFINLLIAIVASIIITRGMKNTRKRIWIILGLVILIIWSTGMVFDGGTKTLGYALPF